jgi:hypothetical protein
MCQIHRLAQRQYFFSNKTKQNKRGAWRKLDIPTEKESCEKIPISATEFARGLHRNLSSYSRRFIHEKGANIFSSAPPYFVLVCTFVDPRKNVPMK